MNTHSLVSKILWIVAALCFAHSSLAQDSISTEIVSVTIFSNRYISDGQEFASLEALEAWIKPMRPRAIRLNACEPATSRQLLAAAYRFRHVHLEMRQLASGQSVCAEDAARAVRVGGISQALTLDEDKVINEYWRGLMP